MLTLCFLVLCPNFLLNLDICVSKSRCVWFYLRNSVLEFKAVYHKAETAFGKFLFLVLKYDDCIPDALEDLIKKTRSILHMKVLCN